MAKPKYEKYLTPIGLLELEELAYSHRDEPLAKILGVKPRQLKIWCRAHIEINDAIERGRARAVKVNTPLPPVKETREVLEDMLAWCDGVMA